MSIKSVNQFLTKVNEDEQLQAELSQATSAKNDLQATVELAAKHGYNFTIEELNGQVEQFRSIGANHKLNESELKAVAGGLCAGLPAPGLIDPGAKLIDSLNKGENPFS